MFPVHLSANTPSTSNPNGNKKEMETRTTLGISSGNAVRYMCPIPMIGTVPVRIRVRPPLDDGIRIEPLTIGPRSIDFHRFPPQPSTFVARKRRPPLRAPIFDIIQVSYSFIFNTLSCLFFFFQDQKCLIGFDNE